MSEYGVRRGGRRDPPPLPVFLSAWRTAFLMWRLAQMVTRDGSANANAWRGALNFGMVSSRDMRREAWAGLCGRFWGGGEG